MTKQNAKKPASGAQGATMDAAELAKFAAMAAEWWNPRGKFAPLHKFNPTRLDFIKNHIETHFGLDPNTGFKDLRLLDIGCGGGLLSEPMARLGATVTGADAGEANIKTAQIHATEQGLTINYRHITAEQLVEEGAQFDIILNMEVIEHVADINLFLEACSALLAPNGLMFMATLNRTLKAYALAIVGAEYVLGWLPRGTHDWTKFIKPAELEHALAAAGLTVHHMTGVSYNPLSDQWRLSGDLAVNYMLTAIKD